MKKILGITITLILLAGTALDAAAKQEKKNEPSSRFVKETLEALGGEHHPEQMSVKSIDSIEIGDTYYHIFQGKIDSTKYHVIIFDNYENYLGFYTTEFPLSNYEREGHITLETGDVNEYGDPLRYYIPLEKGPPAVIVIGTKQTKFVKGPAKEETETAEGTPAAEDTPAAEESVVPEFREWSITLKGRTYHVPAIYVSQTFATVTLRGEGTGNEKEFPINSLSPEDREYIEQFK
jgi:hypothetical protein